MLLTLADSGDIDLDAGTTIDLNGTSTATATTITTTSGDIDLDAGTNITSDHADNTINTGSGTLTLTAGTTTTTGSIGTPDNPITIARTTNNWSGGSGGNLSLTAGTTGSIYLETATAGAYFAIPASFANTFSLNQTAGDISIPNTSSSIVRTSATIMLNASDTNNNANITIDGFLTASSLSLTATGTITGTASPAADNNLTLNATGGIGTSDTSPLNIVRSGGDWSASNLTLITSGNIYLRTAFAGAHLAIPASFARTFDLDQTSGDIVFISSVAVSALNLDADGNIDFGDNDIDVTGSFNARADNGNITGGTITAISMTLRAPNGFIGEATNRIRVRSRGNNSIIFIAQASTTTAGNIYLSTNNNALIAPISSGLTGGGTTSIISELPVAKKQAKPGGALSSALDPILDLFGSGCEKDDVLATVISGFGILCGEE